MNTFHPAQKTTEVKTLRKVLLIVVAVSLLGVFATAALAADITPKIYTKTGSSADFNNYSLGNVTTTYPGFTTSTHLYGTWNNPYTAGIEGYNYNDAQSYPYYEQGRVIFFWGDALNHFYPMGPGGPSLAYLMGYTEAQTQQYFPYVVPAGMSYDTSEGTWSMKGVGLTAVTRQTPTSAATATQCTVRRVSSN